MGVNSDLTIEFRLNLTSIPVVDSMSDSLTTSLRGYDRRVGAFVVEWEKVHNLKTFGNPATHSNPQDIRELLAYLARLNGSNIVRSKRLSTVR